MGSLCPGRGSVQRGVSVQGSLSGRPSRRNMGPETHPEGTWDQAARQEVTSYRDTPVNKQTGVKTVAYSELRLRVVKRTTIKWRLKALPWKRVVFSNPHVILRHTTFVLHIRVFFLQVLQWSFPVNDLQHLIINKISQGTCNTYASTKRE